MHPERRLATRIVIVCAFVVLAAILAAGSFAGGYTGTRAVRSEIATPSSTPPTPSGLASATAAPSAPRSASSGTPDLPARVATALKAALAAPALGTHVVGQVVDAASGTVLFGQAATATVAPASTAKLLTAAAALLTRGADYRITTTAVSDGNGTIALVGAGDPTLTAAAAGHDGAYADAARLADLAAQLRTARVTVTRIVVVDSLFTGLPASPAWAPGDIPSSYAAPITALMVDGGRDTPDAAIRSSAPDLAAGQQFAALLGNRAIPVARGSAPAGAQTVASVRSAPISTLVAQMLQSSDNVIAECLARQVALATQAPASFLGAAAAVRRVLVGAGVDPGAGMVDGSGLAAGDRLSAATLVAVLRLATAADHPDLHDLVAGLPVAAWTGTLSNRYLSGTTRAGAGTVRAKTGTLTGVASLAGLVHDADGRQLAFAFVADKVPGGDAGTAAADAALDRIAATLAACGCA